MSPDRLRRHWGAVGFLLLLGWFWRHCGTMPLLLILFAAAIHEGGHLLALRLLGAPAGKLRLSLFGAALFTEDLRLSYPAELLAVLAGPAANLLCGSLLGRFSNSDLAAAMAGAHWTLGLFNLLPASPLDGWRFLELFLCWVLGPGIGGRIAGLLGCVCSLAAALAIVWLMLLSGGNLWLLPAAAGLAISGIKAAVW